ncbi:MAG: MBL fold metallo-hydrolase, partial [Syntrophales bacterium]|nr:MBL fold metallo-hydrolase [Syntrophales bacterium]
TGGLDEMAALLGKRDVPLVVHPAVFRESRYLKMPTGEKVLLTAITRERVAAAGLTVREAKGPTLLMDDTVLFLGEIPRETDFEKGFPIAHYERDGQEHWDPIEDDTSIVMHLRGKGLVVISGCAHAGIVNTVRYARKVTGMERVHAVMGGFHLSGPLFEGIIGRTIAELEKMDPDYVIPCHCTGRKAVMAVEKALPGRFLLNMAGTRMTFTA